MPDYAFFFEINEINLILEDFLEILDPFTDFNEGELQLKSELVEYFELINPSVLTQLQDILNSVIPGCHIDHVYLLGLKIPSRVFEFIIIHFTNEKSSEIQKLRKELNLFLKLIDSHGVFIRNIRFITDMFVDGQMFEGFLGKYNSILRRHEIEAFIAKHVNIMGDILDIQYCFLFECPVFISLKIEGILKRTVKNYFRRFFPDLLRFRNIRVTALEVSNIFELPTSGVVKQLFFEIRKYLLSFIWETYRILGLMIYNFSEWLSNLFFSYQKFNTKKLLKLKMYLEEFKGNYYAIYPTFFIFDFDNFALEHARVHSTGRIIFEETDKLREYERIYPELLSSLRQFLVQYYRFKPVLDKNLDKIDDLIQHKKDNITIFTREELELKLKEIKKEQEFQELLAQILENLGCENIKINCGTRGHDEHGKDIVFSNLNLFGSREWNAVVVKIGKIRAEEGRELYDYVKKIIDQGSDALKIEYIDDKGSEFPITRVFIAVNKTITDQAKRSIRKKIEGGVFFIEKDTLLNMCL